MEKRAHRKMELHRETLRQLDYHALEAVQAGVDTTFTTATTATTATGGKTITTVTIITTVTTFTD